jgi:hypothetical protein
VLWTTIRVWSVNWRFAWRARVGIHVFTSPIALGSWRLLCQTAGSVGVRLRKLVEIRSRRSVLFDSLKISCSSTCARARPVFAVPFACMLPLGKPRLAMVMLPRALRHAAAPIADFLRTSSCYSRPCSPSLSVSPSRSHVCLPASRYLQPPVSLPHATPLPALPAPCQA